MNSKDLKPISTEGGDPVCIAPWSEYHSWEEEGSLWWKLLGLATIPLAWGVVFLVVYLMVEWMK